MGYEIIRIVAVCGLAVTGLAACDSSTGDSASVDDYNDMAIAYNDLRGDVQAMPLANVSNMPTVGTATYIGHATVLVDTPRDTQLVGDARLQANFTYSDISGTLGNFVGTVDGSEYADYSGTLDLTDGEIGVGTASALRSDLSGTLTSADDRLTVSGGVQGNFRTDGAVNAVGLTAADTADTDFIVNGRGFDGDVGIVAIR